MKKVFYGLAIIAAFSYKTLAIEDTIQIAGAYKLLLQVLTIGPKDTSFGDMRQLKIFTSDYMMYANVNKSNPDSVSSFGIGRYSISGGKVIENVIYSATGANISSEPATFSLDITKTTKGFKQFIPDLGPSAGRKVTLTEEYENVGSSTVSPLDGAWKQVKSYTINGKDTVMGQDTQFKTYYAGHFIWGRTYKDSTNRNYTRIGFGTFTSNGNNKIRETVTISSYSAINGQNVDIDIKMNGKDEFQQVISSAPGQKGVEVYERLKK